MLDAVFTKTPEVNFCYFAYRTTPILKFGRRLISSQEGVRQGDLLNPLAFYPNHFFHNFITKSELLVGYIDG